MNFTRMCRDLAKIPEKTWAAYALLREPLRGRLTPEDFLPYYEEARRCGCAQADQILVSQGSVSCAELAEALGVEIRDLPMPRVGGIVTFACYYEDGRIDLFRDNGEATTELLKNAGLLELFGYPDVPELLLAHELFHALQGGEKGLYVNRKHIVLWKLGKYARRGRLLSLEEAAAMAFAQHLLGGKVNPYAFDVLMLLPRFPEQAENLYRTVMTLREDTAAGEQLRPCRHLCPEEPV